MVPVQLSREREREWDRRTVLRTARPIHTTIPVDGQPTTGTPTAATTPPPPDRLPAHPTRQQPTHRPERPPRGIRTTSCRGYRHRSFRLRSSTSSRRSSSSISPIRPATAPVTCPLTADRAEPRNSASPSLPAAIRTRP